MYMDRTLANQGNENTIRLQRVTQGWGEGTSNASGQEGAGTSATVGDATWLHALYDTDLWQTPGGSFEPAVSAMTSVNLQGAYLWGSTPKMVSDIQSWLELPSQNYGWILVGNESSLPTAKRFRSRHYPDAAFRPMLIITYVEGELPYALYLPAATAE
jgi:hypothetical protein